ncbi:MAG: class I SAM-dependent methyltransferase [Candidatus Pacebacteria bacterium]|nr:class I SAM-dependent methyltransferase [Candidatus Paceibacterota bacterium]
MKTNNVQYHKQLSNAFFDKNGKSSALPTIIKTIEEQLKIKKTINFLDIGCNRGTLYSILKIIIYENKWEDRINFYGIDYDKKSIELCSKRHNDVIFYNINLNKINIKIKDHFDIITSINTLHEVFSGYILKQSGKNDLSFKNAKTHTEAVLTELIKLLNKNSSFIIYDGLDVETFQYENIVRFSFVNAKDKDLFNIFVKEYEPIPINVKEINLNLFETSKSNLLRLISTFKYINTDIWDIERKQTYHFFSITDFKNTAYNNNLKIETIKSFSNDIELWKSKFILEDSDWPEKSVLIKYNN